MSNYERVKDYRKRIKERLVYVFDGKCQLCGYNKSLQALEFHHIDPSNKPFAIGHSQIHNWEKIKEESKKCILVCANCHREIHAGLHQDIFISGYNEEKAQKISQLVQDLKIHEKTYCPDCGTILNKGAVRCKKCSFLQRRKVKRPSREVLKQSIRVKSFREIGREYQVTDNAIRNLCQIYQLPSRKMDIWLIDDKDWESI